MSNKVNIYIVVFILRSIVGGQSSGKHSHVNIYVCVYISAYQKQNQQNQNRIFQFNK